MGVIESATRLFDLLAAQDNTFTKHLQPGLPPEEIAALVEPPGIVLPPEVLTFYRHFNLPEGYFYGPEQPALYGIYWLLGLEEAVEEYKLRQTFDFLSEEERRCLPFLAEDGNGYLVDTVPEADGNHRVISEFHGIGPSVAFLNLTAMFDTFYHWRQEGGAGTEHGGVNYEGEPERLKEIWTRINPGI